MLVTFGKNVSLCFLCSLLEKIEQETWRETGISFVTSVTRLVERLLDYRYAEIKLSIINANSSCREIAEKNPIFMFRDCMKGDEVENKKIGGSVNLMVRRP